MRTHYEALGVSPNASKAEIRAAYYRLIKLHHPDKAGPRGVKRTQEINAAYDVLKDPNKRARYDLDLRRAQERAGSSPPPPGPDPEPEEEEQPEPEPEPQPDEPQPRAAAVSARKPLFQWQDVLAMLAGACAAHAMGAALMVFFFYPPCVYAVPVIVRVFGPDGAAAYTLAANLGGGYGCAMFAARVALKIRYNDPDKRPGWAFRVALLTAIGVTSFGRGILLPEGTNAAYFILLFLLGALPALALRRWPGG